MKQSVIFPKIPCRSLAVMISIIILIGVFPIFTLAAPVTDAMIVTVKNITGAVVDNDNMKITASVDASEVALSFTPHGNMTIPQATFTWIVYSDKELKNKVTLINDKLPLAAGLNTFWMKTTYLQNDMATPVTAEYQLLLTSTSDGAAAPPTTTPGPDGGGTADKAPTPPAGASPQAAAEFIVNLMTFEEMAGQLIFPRAPSEVVLSAKSIETIRKSNFGGICIFSPDVAGTMDQMIELIRTMQETAIAGSRFSIPLATSIDLEGGNVYRFGAGDPASFMGTTMPGNMALGASNNEDLAYRVGKVIGTEALAGGFNMNLAPSVDVNVNPANPVIGVRSIGSDPQLVAKIGAALVKGMQDAGVMTSAKHFPGHGNTASDSHVAVPLVPGDMDYLRKNDLIPFKAAIDAGASMVMTAHVTVPDADVDKNGDTIYMTGTLPNEEGKFNTFPRLATLSPWFMTEVLRKELGFKGLVITDALDMDAIYKNFLPSDAVYYAIMAGADIPLIPISGSAVSDPPTFLADVYAGLFKELKEKADKEKAFMDRVRESSIRVIRTKIEMGIYDPWAGANQPPVKGTLQEAQAAARNTIRKASHLAVEKEASDAAIALAKNDEIKGKRVLPFGLKDGNTVYVLTSAIAEGRSEILVAAVTQAAAKLGVKITIKSGVYAEAEDVSASPPAGAKLFTDEHKTGISDADFVIVGSIINNGSSRLPTHTRVQTLTAIWDFIEEKGYQGKSVNISLGLPYEEGFLRNAAAMLNINARSNNNIANASRIKEGFIPVPVYLSAMEAAFGVLTPTGKYPVDVPSVLDADSGKLVRKVGDGLQNFGGSGAVFNDIGNLLPNVRIEVEKAASMGIVEGFPDGSFRPSNQVTTQEAVTMVLRVIKVPVEWATAMETGVANGLISSGLNPNAPMSRIATAQLLANALKSLDKLPELTDTKVKELLSMYSDLGGLTGDAALAMAVTIDAVIFTGHVGGTMDPDGILNRSQMASIAVRLSDVILAG